MRDRAPSGSIGPSADRGTIVAAVDRRVSVFAAQLLLRRPEDDQPLQVLHRRPGGAAGRHPASAGRREASADRAEGGAAQHDDAVRQGGEGTPARPAPAGQRPPDTSRPSMSQSRGCHTASPHPTRPSVAPLATPTNLRFWAAPLTPFRQLPRL